LYHPASGVIVAGPDERPGSLINLPRLASFMDAAEGPFALAVGLITFLAVAAAGAGTEGVSEAAKTWDVELKNLEFLPKDLTIEKGDSVRFVNRDSTCHTVTRGKSTEVTCTGSGSKAESNFDVVLNKSGDETTITFASAGTVEVYCKPHSPTMMLTLTVKEPAAPPAQRTPGFEAAALFAGMLGAAAVAAVVLARNRSRKPLA
jgi:plastocyanin